MKLLKSQLLTKASVLALAVSGLVGLQAYPVEAARSDCASPGYFCAWADPNYTGYRGQWYGNSSDWNNNIENKDSSVWNSSTGYVVRSISTRAMARTCTACPRVPTRTISTTTGVSRTTTGVRTPGTTTAESVGD